VLTPKVPWLCYHQKCPKTPIYSTNTKIWKKKTFFDICNRRILWHTILKRCGKYFKNFHLVDCKILALESTKIHFLAVQKIKHFHFTSSYLYEKLSMLLVLLRIHGSSQVSYMLENFQIIWNCTTYRKKIISRTK